MEGNETRALASETPPAAHSLLSPSTAPWSLHCPLLCLASSSRVSRLSCAASLLYCASFSQPGSHAAMTLVTLPSAPHLNFSFSRWLLSINTEVYGHCTVLWSYLNLRICAPHPTMSQSFLWLSSLSIQLL